MTETKKPPYAEGIEWLSENIDIEVMYRIKGKQGIFMPVSKPNKSGMIRMVRFMLDEAYTVNKFYLQGLSGSVIYKDNGETSSLLDSFDNLQKHFKNQSTYCKDLETSTVEKQMELIGDKEDIMNVVCPDYDPYRFKDYHVLKIIKWYNEIISAINKASN